jgi:hypothetical protein
MCPARLCILALGLLLLATGCDRSGGGSGPIGPTPFGPGPTFDYPAGGSGCSDIHLYLANRDQSEVLIVWADAERLGIKEGLNTFDLATASKDLSVTVNVYPRPQKHLRLCQDFTDPESDEPVVWTGVRGKVTVERFPNDRDAEGRQHTYQARATIEGVEFRDPAGRAVQCPTAITIEATVGWVPG